VPRCVLGSTRLALSLVAELFFPIYKRKYYVVRRGYEEEEEVDTIDSKGRRRKEGTMEGRECTEERNLAEKGIFLDHFVT